MSERDEFGGYTEREAMEIMGMPVPAPTPLQSRTVIPAEAVEAAARALSIHTMVDDSPENEKFREAVRAEARLALEAAAPHMREDKRGDGDYRPGWDDRKTLSSLWQEHAPLPDEGLSERVYEALIAVATWGYQQRKDEEL